jgi:hypothetical protein
MMRTVFVVSAALALAACGGGDESSAPTFTCANGGRPVAISVGEVKQLTAEERSSFCLRGGGGADEYVLVPFYGSTVASANIQLDLSAEGAVAPAGATAGLAPQVTVATPGAAGLGAVQPAPVPDVAFHRSLRRAERALAPRLVAARRARAAERAAGRPLALSQARLADLQVNDVLSLNSNSGGCSAPAFSDGRVAAVTTHAIIIADVSNPPDGFTDADYSRLGATFDTLVYPTDVDNFLDPTDINGDGKVIVFYTRAVNELTEEGSDSYVGGFFNSRDLLPRDAIPDQNYGGCPGSNEAEMFYMLAPDPTGVVNGNARSKGFVDTVTVATLAHELQHLINATRRVFINDATSLEEVWLNEGLSHIAEELIFYRASGLQPNRNLGLAELRASERTLSAANRYARNNIARLVEYLEAPEGNSPYADNDELATRGATWELLRFAADRRGGDQRLVWRALVNSKTSGATNFDAVFGIGLPEFGREWAVAQYLDDNAQLGRGSRYNYPSWNFRSVIPPLINSSFPLKTRALSGSAPESITLAAGGASYVRFGVPEGVIVPVTPTVQGGALPLEVDLTLVRIK